MLLDQHTDFSRGRSGGLVFPSLAGEIRAKGSTPRSERSPWGGNGNPLQYSYLRKPMDSGAWWATVHRIAKSQTQLKWPRTYKHSFHALSGWPPPSHQHNVFTHPGALWTSTFMCLEGVTEFSLCRHDFINHWLLVIMNSIPSMSSYPIPPKLEAEAKVSRFWSRLGLSYSQSPSWSCLGADQSCPIRKKAPYYPYHSGNSKVLRALCQGLENHSIPLVA